MDNKLIKVKLKGNESFNFREGWLRKGVRCISEYPELFSRDDVMEILGVGSKMVKSIRYWLRATKLCGENNRIVGLTSFGEIINEYDPYFDDISTLFFIHFKIVSNENDCMMWHIFFNEYSADEFSKEDMESACKIYLEKKMAEGTSFSESSMKDDCSSILKMYLPSKQSDDPEESLACPLSELGLLVRSTENKNLLVKTSPKKGKLDKLVVLYVITENLEKDKNSISIDDLQYASNNIGKVFNLNRAKINDYLDQLRAAGYITINRTAGLDMVYLKERIDSEKIMEKYYKSIQEK